MPAHRPGPAALAPRLNHEGRDACVSRGTPARARRGDRCRGARIDLRAPGRRGAAGHRGVAPDARQRDRRPARVALRSWCIRAPGCAHSGTDCRRRAAARRPLRHLDHLVALHLDCQQRGARHERTHLGWPDRCADGHAQVVAPDVVGSRPERPGIGGDRLGKCAPRNRNAQGRPARCCRGYLYRGISDARAAHPAQAALPAIRGARLRGRGAVPVDHSARHWNTADRVQRPHLVGPGRHRSGVTGDRSQRLQLVAAASESRHRGRHPAWRTDPRVAPRSSVLRRADCASDACRGRADPGCNPGRGAGRASLSRAGPLAIRRRRWGRAASVFAAGPRTASAWR